MSLVICMMLFLYRCTMKKATAAVVSYVRQSWLNMSCKLGLAVSMVAATYV